MPPGRNIKSFWSADIQIPCWKRCRVSPTINTMESACQAHPCHLLFCCIPSGMDEQHAFIQTSGQSPKEKASRVRRLNNGTELYSTSYRGNIHPAEVNPKKHRAPLANFLIDGVTEPCLTQRKRFPLPLEPLQKHYSLLHKGITRASVFSPKKKKKNLTSGSFFSHQWQLYSPLASHWLYCWNYCQATIYIACTWVSFLPCVNCTKADLQHHKYRAKTRHSFSFMAAAHGWRVEQLRLCVVGFVNCHVGKRYEQ